MLQYEPHFTPVLVFTAAAKITLSMCSSATAAKLPGMGPGREAGWLTEEQAQADRRYAAKQLGRRRTSGPYLWQALLSPSTADAAARSRRTAGCLTAAR